MKPSACGTSWAVLAAIGAVGIVVGVAGCGSTGTSKQVEIAGGDYPRAFELTRESLREFDFRLDRVDAASGVISTATRPSSGLGTPWDPQQSGIDQEWEDFINRQRRTVRVTFAPQAAGAESVAMRESGSAKAVALVDLRDEAGPVVATVNVTVERIQRPSWQVSTKSVNNSTYYVDPELVSAGKSPTYVVELEPDDRLAKRIAESLRRKLAAGQVAE